MVGEKQKGIRKKKKNNAESNQDPTHSNTVGATSSWVTI